ncbi:uncharacterized protein LOC113855973 [Abrus precatorius]|uniref:Uncharacterized protein LOC113855973 n=1 Tax=Abrus precatorius TaxID=3816 RepID=A0A8B8KJF7_ABRPR|nr:uncharacterized protein LOC113855973 [Abrus precatorius]
MEDKDNLIKKSRGEGCPTRLQKHAPASLDIDRPSNPFAEASKAIPLLSPLILSPQPTYAEISVKAPTSENSVNHGSINEGIPATGSEHPAMASFPEPLSLSSFFQKQCVFVNHAQ